MKLKEKLKMSSELNSKTKFVIIFNLFCLFLAITVHADPVVAGEVLPPASATVIADPDLIRKIGVGKPDEPVWCYSNDANAIIVSAPQRIREECRLNLSQELEKQGAIHKLQLDTLKIEIESLNKRNKEILMLKDKEIESLTQAALKRPNDYTIWWASAGVIIGVVSTLLIASVIK